MSLNAYHRNQSTNISVNQWQSNKIDIYRYIYIYLYDIQKCRIYIFHIRKEKEKRKKIVANTIETITNYDTL